MWTPKVPWIRVVCGKPGCGKEFEVQPAVHRNRIKRSRNGTLYCSRNCAGRLMTVGVKPKTVKQEVKEIAPEVKPVPKKDFWKKKWFDFRSE